MVDKQIYIKRFKKLYQQKRGASIDDATALEHFEGLVELVRNVFQPIPASRKKELEQLLKE